MHTRPCKFKKKLALCLLAVGVCRVPLQIDYYTRTQKTLSDGVDWPKVMYEKIFKTERAWTKLKRPFEKGFVWTDVDTGEVLMTLDDMYVCEREGRQVHVGYPLLACSFTCCYDRSLLM